MPEARKRPCSICRRWFRPDPRVGDRQHACTKPECQTARRPDRLFAAQLHERAVPLDVAENALTLAVARRLARAADAPPLGAIRSLAYFAPVIEEVLQTRPSPQYFHHLRQRIQKIVSAR